MYIYVLFVCTSTNSFQSSECCVAKLAMGTQWVTGMIIFFLLNFFNLFILFFWGGGGGGGGDMKSGTQKTPFLVTLMLVHISSTKKVPIRGIQHII